MRGLSERETGQLRAIGIADTLADRFTFVRTAGRGGMGRVFEVVDQETNRRLAVKVLEQTGSTGLERFARESEILERLEHPAIVRYVAHGSLQTGDCYLAMEWLEGESLEERLRRGRLSVGEAVTFARRITGALHAAHTAGV